MNRSEESGIRSQETDKEGKRQVCWLFVNWLWLFWLALVHQPAWATSYPEALNLVKLTAKAERIFLGEVFSRKTGKDPVGLPATVYTFRVEQVLKGTIDNTIMIKQIGVANPVEDPNTHAITFPIAGMPVYEPGQHYVLFLNGTSEVGFTSPVGLGYGAFVVLPKGQVVNNLNNADLFRDILSPSSSASPIGKLVID